MAEIHDARDALLRAIQEEQREIRADQRRMMDLMGQMAGTQARQGEMLEKVLVEMSGLESRLSRKMGEVRDDLNLIIQTQVGGGMAHIETRLEQRQERSLEMDRLSRELRIEALERRIEALEKKVGGA
jgi:hypothetical protein